MRIETLERITEKASRGPWRWNPELTVMRGFDGKEVLCANYRGVSVNRSDAAFIYTASVFMPKLIDVLRSAKAFLEQGSPERRADLAQSIRQLEDL